MRKTAIIILLTAAYTAVMSAQNAYDALMFSENRYEGTARTVAMNNAFTALGGDLGAVTINPAASAVAPYSQFTITPGISLSSTRSRGISQPGNDPLFFDREMRSSRTAFELPNLGFTMNWDTGRKYGVKNISFGFVVNMTNSWNQDVYANGVNRNRTSFMAEMADYATYRGYTTTELGAADAFDKGPADWKSIIGYQTGMFSTYGDYNDRYVAASEQIWANDEIQVGGDLDQTFGKKKEGSKCEYVFNFGFNVSDFLFIGANLGINAISYDYSEYFKEAAVYKDDFKIELSEGGVMYFDRMKYMYKYNAEGTGVFAKLGFILTPGNGLRLGAAIQTPVLNTIEEEWSEGGEIVCSGPNGYSSSLNSPYGEGQYTLKSPFRANFGAAYTFGKFGLISADYEVCDYSTMEYTNIDHMDKDWFESVNNDIRHTFGISHMFRAGAEIKPLPSLAIRGGYGFTTSAEKYGFNGEELPVMYAHQASFGLGYSSAGSFFADIACLKYFDSTEYTKPYEDYLGTYDDDGNFTPDMNYLSPEIRSISSLWKVVLTLGWRF